jgi:L-iditol 2-dehydrogenase
MGVLTAQVARASGGLVTVAGLDRDGSRLDLAASLGFDTLVIGPDGPALDQAPDVVCECSGAAGAASYALEQVGKGGRYVQVGIFGGPVTVPLDNVLYKEVTLTSGNASTPVSWRRAMTLLGRGLVDLDPLITEAAPLGEWERVFASVRAGEGMKYVLVPEGDVPR